MCSVRIMFNTYSYFLDDIIIIASQYTIVISVSVQILKQNLKQFSFTFGRYAGIAQTYLSDLMSIISMIVQIHINIFLPIKIIGKKKRKQRMITYHIKSID